MEERGATPLLCDICAAPVRSTKSQDMATSPVRSLYAKPNSTQIYSSFSSSSNSNFSSNSSFNLSSNPSYSFSSLDFNSISQHSSDSGLSFDSGHSNKTVSPAADRFRQWFQAAIFSAESVPLLSRTASVPRDLDNPTKEASGAARLSSEPDLSIGERSFLTYHPSPGEGKQPDSPDLSPDTGEPLHPSTEDRPGNSGYSTSSSVTGQGPRTARVPEYQSTRVPEYQNDRLPEYQSARMPEYQSTRLPSLVRGSQPPMTTPCGPSKMRPLSWPMPNQAPMTTPCGPSQTRPLSWPMPDQARESSLPPPGPGQTYESTQKDQETRPMPEPLSGPSRRPCSRPFHTSGR